MMQGFALKEAKEWERTRYLAFTVARTVTDKIKRPENLFGIPLIDENDKEADAEEMRRRFLEQAKRVEKNFLETGGVKPKPKTKNGKRKA